MADGDKRPRGRPRKAKTHVPISFKMQKEQADYLLAVAARFGWGTEINEVVRNVLVGEVIALQKADFHEKRLPTPPRAASSRPTDGRPGGQAPRT